jgi:hypothetical protein
MFYDILVIKIYINKKYFFDNMDEILKRKLNSPKIDTINDLEDKDYIEYKKEYFISNENVIRKYFGYLDLAKLNQTFLGKFIFPIDKLAKDGSNFWVSSGLKYGKKNLFVPVDFYTLTETVLSLDVRVGGIFRVRNSLVTVKECVDMLEAEISNRSFFSEIRDRLAENFNVIDLTTAFKEVVRNYKHTTIPENLLGIVLKLSHIDDEVDRLVLYHYFYLSLPKFNRHLLEAIIFFLYLIHDIATDDGANYEDNMNMEGISTVMMPNLLLKNYNDIGLEQVPLLVNFMKEFILNFPKIVSQNPRL